VPQITASNIGKSEKNNHDIIIFNGESSKCDLRTTTNCPNSALELTRDERTLIQVVGEDFFGEQEGDLFNLGSKGEGVLGLLGQSRAKKIRAMARVLRTS